MWSCHGGSLVLEWGGGGETVNGKAHGFFRIVRVQHGE